jgi:hypothetical protein
VRRRGAWSCRPVIGTPSGSGGAVCANRLNFLHPPFWGRVRMSQNPAASDAQGDQCLCPSLVAPQVQADAPSNGHKMGVTWFRWANPHLFAHWILGRPDTCGPERRDGIALSLGGWPCNDEVAACYCLHCHVRRSTKCSVSRAWGLHSIPDSIPAGLSGAVSPSPALSAAAQTTAIPPPSAGIETERHGRPLLT